MPYGAGVGVVGPRGERGPFLAEEVGVVEVGDLAFILTGVTLGESEVGVFAGSSAMAEIEGGNRGSKKSLPIRCTRWRD